MRDTFAEPNSHVFEEFIKPVELTALLERQGLAPGEMRGIVSRRNPIASLLDFRRRVKGKITFKELGRRLDFQESDHLEASYMGYATRKPGWAMKKLRSWVTPITSGSFLLLGVTGLLMFFKERGGLIFVADEWLSPIFVVGACLHIWLNLGPIKGTRDHRRRSRLAVSSSKPAGTSRAGSDRYFWMKR